MSPSSPRGLSGSALWYVTMPARYSLRLDLHGSTGIRGAWSLRRSVAFDGLCCRQL
ncbi:hypothetical protein KSP40_PGU008786 [Platanthera guangdongensis]|uniref:Uncharacterized protein n=1 Tax=Platanthera guangdongensis TaxID=2320717 RepID=A0ABR2LI46_9ASPA